jgi:hypothetical protein
MKLQDWIKENKPSKNVVTKTVNGYKVSVGKGTAQYDQLFRLSDYSAVKASTGSYLFLIKKEDK